MSFVKYQQLTLTEPNQKTLLPFEKVFCQIIYELISYLV